jgi:hypothetical protein
MFRRRLPQLRAPHSFYTRAKSAFDLPRKRIATVSANMAGRIPGVFVSGLPIDVDQQSLAQHFKRTWDQRVMGIKLLRSSDSDTAAALVDLENQQAAEQVCGLAGFATAVLLCAACGTVATHLPPDVSACSRCNTSDAFWQNAKASKQPTDPSHALSNMASPLVCLHAGPGGMGCHWPQIRWSHCTGRSPQLAGTVHIGLPTLDESCYMTVVHAAHSLCMLIT